MYQFISAQGKNYPVLQLCNVLGATRSSYYAYRNGKIFATSPVEQAEVKQVSAPLQVFFTCKQDK